MSMLPPRSPTWSAGPGAPAGSRGRGALNLRPGLPRCWTASGRHGYLAVTMSVLASRLDRASPPIAPTCGCSRSSPSSSCRAGRAAASAMSPATDVPYCAVGLPLAGGEGHTRLRHVPNVITTVLAANRGKMIRQVRTTGRLTGCSATPNSSTAHGDRPGCGHLGFELFPTRDGRPSSKASCLGVDNAWPLSCSKKWIDPGGACVRE